MQATANILVVDDDPEIRELLGTYLERNGYRAYAVADGRQMRAHLETHTTDLIVLDLMLPGEDGLVLCRDLRAHSRIPIIMLTARGDELDRILGLEMGADDYLPKPFNPRELLARIRVVLRRCAEANFDNPESDAHQFKFAGWALDTVARHLLSPDGVVVALSNGEYRLLHALVTHPNRVLSRDRLMDLLHGREAMPFDRSIDVQIGRLRKKLGDTAQNPTLIRTIRGEGYILSAQVRRDT
jgi:two-component system OmpR family response regulator